MNLSNQSKKYFAFIESNTTGTGCLFLKQAIKKGLKPLFLTSSPSRYPYLEQEFIQPLVIDTNDKDLIVKVLSQYKNLQGVFSSSEYYIETAAYVAEKLALPGNLSTNIANTRNKEILYKLLSNSNILTPKTFTIDSQENANDILQKLTFPIIVKPAIGTGSIGVKLCNNKTEYIDHINNLLTKEVDERNQKCKSKVLVQEYINGQEYSVEALGQGDSLKIIGITQKHLGHLPYFVEIGHDYPALLDKDTQELVTNTIIKALQVMQLNYGPTHTEIRLNGNKVYIIEINPRLAGGMIPAMIKAASGIDLIDASIELFSGNTLKLSSSFCHYSSIRFFLPPKEGKISSIELSFDKNNSDIVSYELLKKENDNACLQGDFRDRIGYIITKSDNPRKCIQLANDIVRSVKINIQEKSINKIQNNLEDTGRLKQSLHPEALKIINPSKVEDFYNDLYFITAIDEAHLIMLLDRKILPLKEVGLLLKTIQTFKQNNFKILRDIPAPRGLYLLYENALIEELGIKIGGVLHTARSRNDINATLFKLKLRELCVDNFKVLWKLRAKLINRASTTQNTVMPIYSQYQTALPGTFAHYLLGIEEALYRDQSSLKNLFDFLDISPLGSGAGGGTSFPINPEITSNLLGFSKFSKNSIDAVASRDLALRAISTLSIAGMTISRITEDLQLWTTNEFKFIDFPDNLSGGSSMMPHKKNPYLLEIIKGKALSTLGYFVSSISIMNKVPFGNSVEVGTEAIKNLKKVFQEFNESVVLLNLIIENLELNPKKMEGNVSDNLTVSTYITDILVKQSSYSFREAHHLVGETIRHAIDNGKNPLEEMFNINEETKRVLKKPITWAHAMEFGGGPGKKNTEHSLNDAITRLNEDAEWLRSKISCYEQAEGLRFNIINKILTSKK